MITLYQMKTNANARLTNMATSDALLRGHSVCWNEQWAFRLLDSSCIFRSSEMWFEVIIFIKPYNHFISFHVSFWASSKLFWPSLSGVACETTSVHDPQSNFRPRSTTSVNIFTTIPHSLLSAWMSLKSMNIMLFHWRELMFWETLPQKHEP